MPLYLKSICAIILCLSAVLKLQSQNKPLHVNGLTNNFEAQAVNATLLNGFFKTLSTKPHKLHSILVAKKDTLVLEAYFNAFTAETTHDLRSVTKSVRSLLMGIAIDKGFVKSVNDPISKYLKTPIPQKHLDARKTQITIKDLLTMSSGLDCNDWDKSSKGQEDKVHKKKDWLQYTLDLPMVHAPGEVAQYCSMGTVLAAEIISRASKMSIATFAETYLFEPLGITTVQWGHTQQKSVLRSGERLYLKPRDMVKLGQLVLQKGQWNGQQIVSETWLREATTPKTTITGIEYGYLWWQFPFKLSQNTIKGILATGNGGQYIMVFPERDMVVVFTGGAYNSQEDKFPFAITQSVLLPAYFENAPKAE